MDVEFPRLENIDDGASRFEKLWKAFSVGKEKYLNYRDNCRGFAASLVKGLKDYLNCPDGNMKFFPPMGEIDRNKQYAIWEAMDLDEEGCWRFRVLITLYERPNVFPYKPVLANIFLTEEDGRFIVGLVADKEKFYIRMDKKEDFEGFFAYFFDLLKKVLGHPFPEKQTASMFFLPEILK